MLSRTHLTWPEAKWTSWGEPLGRSFWSIKQINFQWISRDFPEKNGISMENLGDFSAGLFWLGIWLGANWLANGNWMGYEWNWMKQPYGFYVWKHWGLSTEFGLLSGNLTVCYGTSPCLRGKSSEKMGDDLAPAKCVLPIPLLSYYQRPRYGLPRWWIQYWSMGFLGGIKY